MKTLMATLVLLLCSSNVMAICEYNEILDADEYEQINFKMKVDHMSGKRNSISFERREVAVDEISLGCMVCHNGSLGSGGNVRKAHGESSSISGSHVIGSDYNNISYTKGGYRNIHNVNAMVKFIDGRIGCLSCHDIQNKQKMHLVATLTGSKLCFECHDK